MKFQELYNKLVKCTLIQESPNSIMSRDKETMIFYYDTDEAYSVLLYEMPGGDFKYIFRKDTHNSSGHPALNRILISGDEDEMRTVFSNIPKENIREVKADALIIYQCRVWARNKICSFWSEFRPKLIPIITELLTVLRQNPKDYIFEFDGAIYNQDDDDECYDWEGLHAHTKLPSRFDNIDEVQKTEREKQKKDDKLLLAKIKMGEKPTLNKRVERDGD